MRMYLARMVSTIAIWTAIAHIFAHAHPPSEFRTSEYLLFFGMTLTAATISMRVIWQNYFPPAGYPAGESGKSDF